jgi:hypothetical protein
LVKERIYKDSEVKHLSSWLTNSNERVVVAVSEFTLEKKDKVMHFIVLLDRANVCICANIIQNRKVV